MYSRPCCPAGARSVRSKRYLLPRSCLPVFETGVVTVWCDDFGHLTHQIVDFWISMFAFVTLFAVEMIMEKTCYNVWVNFCRLKVKLLSRLG